jgi:hypothetical protein
MAGAYDTRYATMLAATANLLVTPKVIDEGWVTSGVAFVGVRV